MEIKEAIGQILEDHSGVVAIAGARIYGGKLPQTVTGPSVVYRLSGTEDIKILSSPGVTVLTKSEFRIGCVVKGSGAYGSAAQLDDQVRDALAGLSGIISDGASPESTIRIKGVWRTDSQDFYDDPTETHWVRTDWDIWHMPA